MNTQTETFDFTDLKKEINSRMVKVLKKNNQSYMLIFIGAVVCEIGIFVNLYFLNWQFNQSLIVSVLTCAVTMYITMSSYLKGKKELKQYDLS